MQSPYPEEAREGDPTWRDRYSSPLPVRLSSSSVLKKVPSDVAGERALRLVPARLRVSPCLEAKFQRSRAYFEKRSVKGGGGCCCSSLSLLYWSQYSRMCSSPLPFLQSKGSGYAPRPSLPCSQGPLDWLGETGPKKADRGGPNDSDRL